MSKLAISAFIGMFMGIAFIMGALFTSGHADYFINIPSVFITIGGTTASVIMSFPPKQLKLFFPVFARAFKKTKVDPLRDIETLVELSKTARSSGLLALEDALPRLEGDTFLYTGIQMIVDGTPAEDFDTAMQGIIYFTNQRHNKAAAMMDLVASVAPSLGLLGTYVGLIPMLHNLDDPTSLGPMMALELVSSFYGAFIAYIIFYPLARRLKIMGKDETARNELVLEGLTRLIRGKSPRTIEAELLTFLNSKETKPGGKASANQERAEPESKS